MQATLTKVKWNKGTLENGQAYDYTRVVLQMPIYDDSPNEFGVDYLECEYGTSDKHTELYAFKGKLPCLIECDMVQVMKRGKPVNLVSNIRPVHVRSMKAE